MLGIRYAHVQDVLGGLCVGLRDYVQDHQSACHDGEKKEEEIKSNCPRHLTGGSVLMAHP